MLGWFTPRKIQQNPNISLESPSRFGIENGRLVHRTSLAHIVLGRPQEGNDLTVREDLFGRHATNDLYRFQPRNHRFLHSFYPDAINCWNEIGPELRKIETLSGFKSAIQRIIQPEKKSIFNLHDPNEIRHLYQLRVGLSSLRAHKKRHNFIDTPNDECSCGTGKETTEHFFT